MSQPLKYCLVFFLLWLLGVNKTKQDIGKCHSGVWVFLLSIQIQSVANENIFIMLPFMSHRRSNI